MVAVKAQKSAEALFRLMPNKSCPHYGIRKVLDSVVHSVLLFAAPNHVAKGSGLQQKEEKLELAQRRVAPDCLQSGYLWVTAHQDPSSVRTSRKVIRNSGGRRLLCQISGRKSGPRTLVKQCGQQD